MFELVDDLPKTLLLGDAGVGGGGGNAVKHMIASNIEGVEFICANTDSQALTDMAANTVLQLEVISLKVLEPEQIQMLEGKLHLKMGKFQKLLMVQIWFSLQLV